LYQVQVHVFIKKGLHYLEDFEDTKEVIRIRKSRNRQHNGQNKKAKRTK